MLNIQKYVVGRLVRVVKNTCFIIKVKTADVSPVNVLLFVKLEIEVAVAKDVVFIIDYFDFTFLKVLLF